MTDIVELHRNALDHTAGYVANVKESQLADPTPCEGWDVRELLNHVVSGNLWAAELASGHSIEEVGDRLDGDVLGSDLAAAYAASATAAGDAFAAPGALDAPCAVSYGPVPGSVYAGHRFIDILIHGWDLAVATGQDGHLPTELVDACWEVITPQADMLTASGAFGSKIEADPGADPQTRLLALLGRQAPT